MRADVHRVRMTLVAGVGHRLIEFHGHLLADVHRVRVTLAGQDMFQEHRLPEDQAKSIHPLGHARPGTDHHPQVEGADRRMRKRSLQLVTYCKGK